MSSLEELDISGNQAPLNLQSLCDAALASPALHTLKCTAVQATGQPCCDVRAGMSPYSVVNVVC
jgi:hypothetical protein